MKFYEHEGALWLGAFIVLAIITLGSIFLGTNYSLKRDIAMMENGYQLETVPGEATSVLRKVK